MLFSGSQRLVLQRTLKAVGAVGDVFGLYKWHTSFALSSSSSPPPHRHTHHTLPCTLLHTTQRNIPPSPPPPQLPHPVDVLKQLLPLEGTYGWQAVE